MSLEKTDRMQSIRRRSTVYRLRCCLLCVLLGVSITAYPQTVDEYEVKAAFLFNFTKFVEWPLSANTPTFVLGVLGDDPFGSRIDQLIKGKNVNGRPVEVRRLKDPADARHCQIVFVALAERDKAAKLIAAVRGTPVLTVGETGDFVRLGGIIDLSMSDNRVNLLINADAAEQAGLKISAKLMSLAKLSKTDQQAGK